MAFVRVSPEARLRLNVSARLTAQRSKVASVSKFRSTKSEIITIPIFTKLLLIRIVASRRRGLSLSKRIRWLLPCLSSASLSKSAWVREKKATSEAEIKADDISNSTIPNAPMITSGGGEARRAEAAILNSIDYQAPFPINIQLVKPYCEKRDSHKFY